MPPDDEPERRAVVVWQPPPRAHLEPETVESERRRLAAHVARSEALETAARAAIQLMAARGVIADLVIREMSKYLRLAMSPEFQNMVGPLSPEMILRLAEWASKENRLDQGKATEHVAHIVAPAIDFSKLTQEERDAWRKLAIKGGVPDE